VDVFVDMPGEKDIGLLLATQDCVANNRPFWISRARYQIRVSVFPVPPFSGVATSHSFYIIPQADGSTILSDAGAVGP
jgi:hypothetical protein